MSRLTKFASMYGFPAISGPAEISTFLSNESHVAAYVGYLANCGFTFTTAHKILFSLRAATTALGVPEPPQFSRFIKLALKGYELVFVSAPPRPVISVPMFHFCARTSLADLLATSVTVPSALQDPDLPLVRLARWRAMFSLGFFGALRSGEYTESALLSSCVVFDATSLRFPWLHCGRRPFPPSTQKLRFPSTSWSQSVTRSPKRASSAGTRRIHPSARLPLSHFGLFWARFRPATHLFSLSAGRQALSAALPAAKSWLRFVSTSWPLVLWTPRRYAQPIYMACAMVARLVQSWVGQLALKRNALEAGVATLTQFTPRLPKDPKALWPPWPSLAP